VYSSRVAGAARRCSLNEDAANPVAFISGKVVAALGGAGPLPAGRTRTGRFPAPAAARAELMTTTARDLNVAAQGSCGTVPTTTAPAPVLRRPPACTAWDLLSPPDATCGRGRQRSDGAADCADPDCDGRRVATEPVQPVNRPLLGGACVVTPTVASPTRPCFEPWQLRLLTGVARTGLLLLLSCPLGFFSYDGSA